MAVVIADEDKSVLPRGFCSVTRELCHASCVLSLSMLFVRVSIERAPLAPGSYYATQVGLPAIAGQLGAVYAILCDGSFEPEATNG
jgi:hypothetical protein